MELQVVEKSDHDLFVQTLIDNYRVEGVKRRDGAFFYGPIKSPHERCLDFDCTIPTTTSNIIRLIRVDEGLELKYASGYLCFASLFSEIGKKRKRG